MKKKIKINVELKEKLEKLYSDVYDILGSKEFVNEKIKCEGLIFNDNVELSEEEEYCLLFNLENLKEFIRDVE